MTDKSQLTHLVYEASLDNSLWPELILELTDRLQIAQSGQFLPPEGDGDLTELTEHFRRAFAISEKMVELQERTADMTSVLNTFSVGVALIDDRGTPIVSNQSMDEMASHSGLLTASRVALLTDEGTTAPLPMAQWVARGNRDGATQALALPDQEDVSCLLLPRHEASKMGFPAKAAAVLIATEKASNDGVRSFAEANGLTAREAELLRALISRGDLKKAGIDIGVSYESARTYLKRINEKTGFSSQVDLVNAVNQSPMAAFRDRHLTDAEEFRVRRLMTLRDGRQLEYFILGPEDGTPVVLFDALSGVTIDVLGFPRQCYAHLERHNVRLIVPCRPGGFRSDLKVMSSLRDFTPDIEELLDHLHIDKFSIFSVSFGNGSALAVAHELGDRVERLVMSAAAYPRYKHDNWRELDQFYQLSGILARYWPALFRQVIPFLVRSILQNYERYFERYCKRTRSDDDIRILSHPTVGYRTAKMLEQRSSAGMDGMVEENLLNAQGWDFYVENIDVPSELFHGTYDNVAPVGGAELLAQHLPNAKITTFEGKGHYHHIVNWPWLVARAAGRDTAADAEVYEIPDL